VKISAFLNPPPVYVEFSQNWLKVLHENEALELPLERQPDGRLVPAGKEKTIAALKGFLKIKNWQPRAQAFCAISARGVSLRRLSLPAGMKEEFHQRLLLQVESEFPLPPEELAWGYQLLDGTPSANGVPAKQDLLVAAVKKEIVADYLEILRACGTEPVFTLASLARKNLLNRQPDKFAMLDIGNLQSELTVFEKGIPVNSRIIFWDGKDKPDLTAAELGTLVPSFNGSLNGTKLFLSGNAVSRDFPERLADLLSNGCQVERLEAVENKQSSTALAGLQKFTELAATPPLRIRLEHLRDTTTGTASLDLKKWAVCAGSLIIALLLLPYAEALLLKPHLEEKVAAFKAESARLAVIDRELEFLRGLKQSQPPYLDVLYVFAKSAPPGTRFESLSLNSHGDVSLRCAFRDGQQVAEFRSKLIGSGFFLNVTVEEQVPTPDRQKVNVRISAQEKPLAQLLFLATSLTTNEVGKAAKPSPPGSPPPGISTPPPSPMAAARKETK